jgi:hypothetical protein
MDENIDPWTLRGVYVGRRYTEALGCVSSSERSKVRYTKVEILTLLDGPGY